MVCHNTVNEMDHCARCLDLIKSSSILVCYSCQPVTPLQHSLIDMTILLADSLPPEKSALAPRNEEQDKASTPSRSPENQHTLVVFNLCCLVDPEFRIMSRECPSHLLRLSTRYSIHSAIVSNSLGPPWQPGVRKF